MATTENTDDYIWRDLINPDPGVSEAKDYMGRDIASDDTDYMGRALTYGGDPPSGLSVSPSNVTIPLD